MEKMRHVVVEIRCTEAEAATASTKQKTDAAESFLLIVNFGNLFYTRKLFVDPVCKTIVKWFRHVDDVNVVPKLRLLPSVLCDFGSI